jgi:hypothetical protein
MRRNDWSPSPECAALPRIDEPMRHIGRPQHNDPRRRDRPHAQALLTRGIDAHAKE